MSYKTVLVHLNDDNRAEGVLTAGLTIAERSGAHLVGLYVFPAYRLKAPVPVPFASELAAKIKNSIEEEAERIHKKFERLTANRQAICEWRSITTERRDAASIILEHACAADLVVASQADPNWDMTDVLDLPDDLALGSGGPVLVIPRGGTLNKWPSVVTIGWNGKRESARAIHDALPVLQTADQVHVVTIKDTGDSAEGELPDTELAASLSRHGMSVEISKIDAGATTVGEAIRQFAQSKNSELLVMGCYGHSRIREFAFGGVTRHILRDMTIPVMFSH